MAYGADTNVFKSTERTFCALHEGRVIEKYCKDHDEVCCTECVAVNHSSCAHMKSIKESAKNINLHEYDETRESLDKVISKAILEQDNRSYFLSRIDEQKSEIFNDIDNFEVALNKKVKDLAKATRDEVSSKYSKLVNTVQEDVKKLEDAVSMSEYSSRKFDIYDSNDEQRFIKIKKGKTVVKIASAKVEQVSADWRQNALDYCFSLKPFRNVLDLKTFGHFEEHDDKPYIARKQEIVRVKMNNDDKCLITGICILTNGKIVVSDYNNKKLKLLNNSFDIDCCVKLAASPTSLCTIGNQEVVVALRDEKKIQFVSITNTITLGASFSSQQRCSGICYDSRNDELYVSCDSWAQSSPSRIRVYKRNGSMLRTFENDGDGKGLFSYPKCITISQTTDALYVADERKGLIALHRNGYMEWKSNDPTLKDLYGVCLLPGNQLLVTGRSSKNIVHVGIDGKVICELLDESKGLKFPHAIVFDGNTSRLLVGCLSNNILIYELNRK